MTEDSSCLQDSVFRVNSHVDSLVMLLYRFNANMELTQKVQGLAERILWYKSQDATVQNR